MSAIDEAIEVLRAAEQKLRRLIVQAAEQADYDQLSLLAEWAKQLRAIVDSNITPGTSLNATPALGAPLPVHSSNGTDHRSVLTRVRAPESGARSARGGGRGNKLGKSKRKKPDYPKFLRESEVLVKVGWSRRENKPYEHKAQRSVLQTLVQALTKAGSGGQRFTTEDLFPLKDPADSSEIPDYQAYLTLAWLRGNGLIVQHGRQGYSLQEGTDLERESERLWKKLPAR